MIVSDVNGIPITIGDIVYWRWSSRIPWEYCFPVGAAGVVAAIFFDGTVRIKNQSGDYQIKTPENIMKLSHEDEMLWWLENL